MKRRKFISILLLLILILPILAPLKVEAALVKALFGSFTYNETLGEEFKIGLYLNSDTQIKDYSITLGYDEELMEYVSGADSHGDGTVTVKGTASTKQVKALVHFRALKQGKTDLTIVSAQAVDVSGNLIRISYSKPAPLTIIDPDAPFLDSITVDGEKLKGFAPDVWEYSLTVPFERKYLPVRVDGWDDVKITGQTLYVGENAVTIKLMNEGGTETEYIINVTREEEVIPPPEEEPSEPETPEVSTEEITGESSEPVSEPVSEESSEKLNLPVLPEVNEEPIDGFINFVIDDVRPAESDENQKDGRFLNIVAERIILVVLLDAVVIVVAVSGVESYLEYKKDSEREFKKQLEDQKWEPSTEDTQETRSKKFEDAGPELAPKVKEPVIVVDKVCMDFKVSTQNVSGIKEWVIKKLKRELSYRPLHALKDISFEAYPGEVVGIIGTNGSGKSTLLKIVSGALSPTSGRVMADRSKIQLLTLGTGFDMELTARENVYLNGAIIGYSREFIDWHYDSIVKFAELEGFMEEKVKNFSSGMVSRLGFAIATAGEASEILILDEVLSVGDEFFRKKSLARVKEMIHGGSTVLMVSHSMPTIRENCDIVVWIEKGELRMIGDAKEVCKAYQEMGKEAEHQ